MYQLDHIVLATADLEAAKEAFAAETGVTPVDGGPHLGLGTRNALVSFGDSYLEIIAPDPDQVIEGTFGARLLDMTEPHLLHWAVRVDDLDAVAERARECGLEPTPIRRTSRRTPQGASLTWALMGLRGHRLGGVVPFYIDWLDCVHPSASAPRVGRANFEVALPNGSKEARLLAPTPAGVVVKRGDASLALRFDSPRGEVQFAELGPLGFSL